MKQVSLNVARREQLGRGPSRRLRRDGQIPAVVYGVSEVRHVTVKRPEFRMLWRQISESTALIQLQGLEDPVLTIIQETQQNPITDEFDHLDFLEVEQGKPMTANVPVHVTGEPYGVRQEGGFLDHPTHELEIECLPKDLPEYISLDVTELKVGDSIHVGDLRDYTGVTFRDSEDLVIVAVQGQEAFDDIEAEEEERAADDVEVIGEKEDADDDEESGDGEDDEK